MWGLQVPKIGDMCIVVEIAVPKILQPSNLIHASPLETRIQDAPKENTVVQPRRELAHKTIGNLRRRWVKEYPDTKWEAEASKHVTMSHLLG